MTHRWVLDSFTSRVKLLTFPVVAGILQSDSRTPAAAADQRLMDVLYVYVSAAVYKFTVSAAADISWDSGGQWGEVGGRGVTWRDAQRAEESGEENNVVCGNKREARRWNVNIPLVCGKLWS